jgi:hypothetical protein
MVCGMPKCWSVLNPCFEVYVVITLRRNDGMEHRVLVEKPIVIQLVKKFPASYGTRRFITVFTRVHRSPV